MPSNVRAWNASLTKFPSQRWRLSQTIKCRRFCFQVDSKLRFPKPSAPTQGMPLGDSETAAGAFWLIPAPKPPERRIRIGDSVEALGARVQMVEAPIAGAMTFASRTSSRNSPVRFVGTAAPTSAAVRASQDGDSLWRLKMGWKRLAQIAD